MARMAKPSKPRRIVIQQTTGVTLRVTVEVFRCEALGTWHARWLDREASPEWGKRADAIDRAREVCNTMHAVGITSELIIRRVDGTIGERRTYGQDPAKSKG